MAFELNTSEISEKLRIPREVYEKILTNSFVTTQQEIKDIQSALASGDYPAVKAIAHRLKGIYSNLRIEGLRATSEKMERLAKTNGAKEEIDGNLKKFVEHFEQLKAFFNQNG